MGRDDYMMEKDSSWKEVRELLKGGAEVDFNGSDYVLGRVWKILLIRRLVKAVMVVGICVGIIVWLVSWQVKKAEEMRIEEFLEEQIDFVAWLSGEKETVDLPGQVVGMYVF